MADFAGIVAAFVDREAEQVFCRNAQTLEDGRRQFRFGVIQRQFEFVYAQHGGFL
jgi:hypothetical protein